MLLSRRPTIGVLGAVVAVTAGVLAVTVQPAESPVATDPIRLTSVTVGQDTMTLRWHGSATRYRVRIGTDLDRPSFETTTSTPEAAIRASGVRPSRNGTVRYRVEPIDDDESTTALGGTITLPPDAVARPSVDATDAGSVTVSWKGVDHATAYDIELVADDDAPAELHRVTGDVHSFTSTSLTPGTAHRVRIRAVNSGVVGPFGPAEEFTTLASSRDITIGTWNVCSESCSGYGGRASAMSARVQDAKIDILTVQEAGGERVGRTTNAAFSGGPQGFARASGGALTRYIFYRPALFDQLAGSRFSVGGGRTVTWARFRDKATAQTFLVASVHLSPGKNKAKDATRGRQARALVDGIAQINSAGDPVILAGDFNTGRHRGGDRVIAPLNAAGYSDTVENAERTEGARINTFNKGGGRAIQSGDHVDHIFTSGQIDTIRWIQHVSLTNGRYTGKFLTDHNLLSATVRLSRDTEADVKATPALTLSLDPVTRPTTKAPAP